MRTLRRALFGITALTLLAGCAKPAPGGGTSMQPIEPPTPATALISAETMIAGMPTPREPGAPYLTPTPNAPRTLPTLRTDLEQYVVQWGDSLAYIASLYNLELADVIAANDLANPDALEIGQIINVPAPKPSTTPSDFKIIPDSELVYGPASATLDLEGFIKSQNGYLADHSEKVGKETMSGIEIVDRVSREFSVNPRLLLALLEYRSGWVTSRQIGAEKVDYPMGYVHQYYKGLYMQLAWTANMLNRGYYLYKINALSHTPFSNSGLAPLSNVINPGTAAVQYMLGLNSGPNAWQKAVSEQGVYQTYTQFFGIPFDLAIEPLLPPDLAQPELILPFEDDVVWSFTSGPHAGWGSGSAWAALDFAPPGDQFGCFLSDEWVTASADGVITRSENGIVVIDMDGDGLEQTGWTILYLHIESRDRIAAGTRVKAGDRLGHASCEGGVADGTHVHIARRYNGEWISADTNMPFVLSGWVSAGCGDEYCGTMSRDGVIVESWNGRVDENQIGR